MSSQDQSAAEPAERSRPSGVRALAGTAADAFATAACLVVGCVAILLFSVWHRLVALLPRHPTIRADRARSVAAGSATVAFEPADDGAEGVTGAGTGGAAEAGADGAAEASADDGAETATDDATAEVVEHELSWPRYVKAFDAHHGPEGSPDRDPEEGSFLRGLRVWLGTRLLRGYTLGNEVYVCPAAPRVLRVHQAGHAPAFGGEFETLAEPRREDGGLEDEPLRTLDVMLPGDVPDTLLRLRDPRGLTAAYEEWLRQGRIERVGV